MDKIEITLENYKEVADIAKSTSQEDMQFAIECTKEAVGRSEEVREILERVGKSHNDLLQEFRNNHRKSKMLTIEEMSQIQDDFDTRSTNFIMLIYYALTEIHKGYATMVHTFKGVIPDSLVQTQAKQIGEKLDFQDVQMIKMEFDLNSGKVERYANGLQQLRMIDGLYKLVFNEVEANLDTYYKFLVNRHSKDGVEIQKDPIITDIAMTIYNNIDKHGEIESGKDGKDVSAYTVRKAEIIANVIQNEVINEFITSPREFMDLIEEQLKTMVELGDRMKAKFAERAKQVKDIAMGGWSFMDTYLESRRFPINEKIAAIRDIDPRNVTFTDQSLSMTAAEKFSRTFTNETIKNVVKKIDSRANPQELVSYILQRKQEMREFYLEENSFYTCKIGGGNQFMGKAPGALEVIPAERPNASLDSVIGTGFDEIKQFLKSVETSKMWTPLFLATSPSKSTDKSNVLLIGPQGCGKTEVLRSVGAKKDSIGIFAQGSDFLTCWAGEAEKNPKRLFEEGIRLNRESGGRHVHFLIDEIDSVMNNDHMYSTNKTNLTLEFQILMDGVVSYPNLSVWGATNNPERIPMPMIRRFSKVVIVGELNEEHRIKLLDNFLNFLPLQGFTQEAYKDLATKLEGATGDVIRKIADGVWRDNISRFVKNKRDAAQEMVNFLNKENKFNIADFSKKDRKEFNKLLGKHMVVTPNVVNEYVDKALSNVAIKAEIATAVSTYERAKAHLAGVDHVKDKVEA